MAFVAVAVAATAAAASVVDVAQFCSRTSWFGFLGRAKSFR